MKSKESTSCLAWPFVALWRLLTFILNFTGRLIGVILGLVFLIVGGILIATVVLLPIGIPFALFGILLLIRCLFYTDK